MNNNGFVALGMSGGTVEIRELQARYVVGFECVREIIRTMATPINGAML